VGFRFFSSGWVYRVLESPVEIGPFPKHSTRLMVWFRWRSLSWCMKRSLSCDGYPFLWVDGFPITGSPFSSFPSSSPSICYAEASLTLGCPFFFFFVDGPISFVVSCALHRLLNGPSLFTSLFSLVSERIFARDDPTRRRRLVSLLFSCPCLVSNLEISFTALKVSCPQMEPFSGESWKSLCSFWFLSLAERTSLPPFHKSLKSSHRLLIVPIGKKIFFLFFAIDRCRLCVFLVAPGSFPLKLSPPFSYK